MSTLLVAHDAAAAARNERRVAAAEAARLSRHSPGLAYTLPPPDPNSQFARRSKLAALQLAIAEAEAQRRRDRGEPEPKPFRIAKDYYELLELDRRCSAAEVRRSFRRLSLRYHPDKQLGKSEEQQAAAAAMFAELKEAHACLSDPGARREYDHLMNAKELAKDRNVNLHDIDAALRKSQPRPPRAPPVYYEVELTLREMYEGCEKRVTHRRRGPGSREQQLQLRINVPPGAAAGTEFLFRRLGDHKVARLAPIFRVELSGKWARAARHCALAVA